MTLAPLLEAAGSLAKASSPEPWSASKTSNWVARRGGLPPYIQHISHDLLEQGRAKTESEAIQMAIGIVENPPRNWGADARAAAAKAAAQWAAMKGKQKAGKAAGKLQSSLADEIAVREAALKHVALLEQTIGVAGMVRLLEDEAQLQEASSSSWTPTFKRTASAPEEVERHEVYDGGQHVGTLTRRRGFGAGADGDRYTAFAVNGTRVTDYSEKSRQGAIDALRKHLEEAPARVIALPTAGKYLVAKPASYSGDTTYTQFSTEQAARHAAGLPPAPTGPESSSKVSALAEALCWDLVTISGLDIPPLRRVQEARRRVPLAEGFSSSELRDFRGRWRGGGHGARLTPSSVVPGPRVRRAVSDSAARYEGGVSRASAKVRAAHAAKPQIAVKDLPASIGAGRWSASAAKATRD